MKIRILMASAAALALGACEGRQPGDGENAAAVEDAGIANDMMATNNMVAESPEAVPATGQQYAQMAAASDMYEIESSRLAAQKSQNQAVKQFAQMLVRDHQKSTNDLMAAVKQAQPPITVTPAMNMEQQANMQALNAVGAADFDRTYLQQQVQAHQKALTMVTGYAQGGDVPALKQHASTVAGPIQRHLQQAQQLSQSAGAR